MYNCNILSKISRMKLDSNYAIHSEIHVKGEDMKQMYS